MTDTDRALIERVNRWLAERVPGWVLIDSSMVASTGGAAHFADTVSEVLPHNAIAAATAWLEGEGWECGTDSYGPDPNDFGPCPRPVRICTFYTDGVDAVGHCERSEDPRLAWYRAVDKVREYV